MTATTLPSTAQALRKFRIIAVPLTRPRRPGFGTSTSAPQPGGTGSGLNSLTYYQFQITAKKARKSSLAASSSGGQKTEGDASQNSSSSRWQWPEEGIVQWATAKAADTWAGFGKAKGGWKVCVSFLRDVCVLYRKRCILLSLLIHSCSRSPKQFLRHPAFSLPKACIHNTMLTFPN